MSAERKIPQDEVWHVGMRSGHNANIIYRYDGAQAFEDTAICQVYGIPINQDVARCADSDGMKYAQLIASAPTLAAELAKLREVVTTADAAIQTIVTVIETRPLLYSDTMRGHQLLRDDMWGATTDQLIDLRHALRSALSKAKWRAG